MKKLFVLVCIFTVGFISAGYAQLPKKFIGIWEPVNYKILKKGIIVIIGTKAGHYIFSTNRSRQTAEFDYSKKDDTLTGRLDGAFVVIRYLDREKHILIMPQTHADAVEFKKTEYSQ